MLESISLGLSRKIFLIKFYSVTSLTGKLDSDRAGDSREVNKRIWFTALHIIV